MMNSSDEYDHYLMYSEKGILIWWNPAYRVLDDKLYFAQRHKRR